MIELYGLKFGYGKGGFVLNIPTMDIRRGEVVAVTWLSGCGKTTLLNILAGILKLDSGRLIVDKVNFGDVADGAARNFCGRHIGLIFQEFDLLAYLNVRENIVLPFRINRVLSLTRKAHTRAEEFYHKMGIDHQFAWFRGQLSQGVIVCVMAAEVLAVVLADLTLILALVIVEIQ